MKRAEAPLGTIVPMRFFLSYKEKEPHARVILQGFKRRDVVDTRPNTESPNLSGQIPACRLRLHQAMAPGNNGCQVRLPAE